MLNGAIVRQPAVCSRCGIECHIGGFGSGDGYFVYNDEKLCRGCAKVLRVI